MEKSKTSQYIVILLHVMAWLLMGFIFLFYQPMMIGVRLAPAFWIVNGAHLALLALAFYLNSGRLVPQLLVRDRYAAYAVWVGLLVAGIVLINATLSRKFDIYRLFEEVLGKKLHPKGIDIYVLITALLVLGISTSIAVIQHLQKENQERQALTQQQISTELSFLKNQIHPHFFFNTLNNIFALTFVNVGLARESLHKLSRLMRYLLYENREQVPLSREIGFLKDYIELMRMRLLENMTLEFQEPCVTEDYPIYPMLLLPFVENAFKHGVSSSVPGSIRIKFCQNGSRFRFEVENGIVRKNSSLDDEGGIGLTNTRRRLELLYPGRHCLTVRETPEKSYYILLELEL